MSFMGSHWKCAWYNGFYSLWIWGIEYSWRLHSLTNWDWNNFFSKAKRHKTFIFPFCQVINKCIKCCPLLCQKHDFFIEDHISSKHKKFLCFVIKSIVFYDLLSPHNPRRCTYVISSLIYCKIQQEYEHMNICQAIENLKIVHIWFDTIQSFIWCNTFQC